MDAARPSKSHALDPGQWSPGGTLPLVNYKNQWIEKKLRDGMHATECLECKNKNAKRRGALI